MRSRSPPTAELCVSYNWRPSTWAGNSPDCASPTDEHQPSRRGRRTTASARRSSRRRDTAPRPRTSCAERAGAPRGEGAVDIHGDRPDRRAAGIAKLSGAAPPSSATRVTIAFLESDRPTRPEPAMPMATEQRPGMRPLGRRGGRSLPPRSRVRPMGGVRMRRSGGSRWMTTGRPPAAATAGFRRQLSPAWGRLRGPRPAACYRVALNDRHDLPG